eukprot:9074498-Lingulodinium_polyedra.AAC.1
MLPSAYGFLLRVFGRRNTSAFRHGWRSTQRLRPPLVRNWRSMCSALTSGKHCGNLRHWRCAVPGLRS